MNCKRVIAKFVITLLVFWPLWCNAVNVDGIRGTRYCEIFIQKKGLTFSVYNTFGLNDCPEELWKKISVAKIKKQTGSFYVHLNGPRYFLMDKFMDTYLVSKEEREFGSIEMRSAAIIHLSPWDLIQKNSSYREHKVSRHTTWVYDAKKPVYELINPKGEVFVMQSYSVQLIPQNEVLLSSLGERLKLPKGWHFKTGLTDRVNYVKTHANEAIIVQDEFLNTYQKADSDFLE